MRLPDRLLGFPPLPETLEPPIAELVRALRFIGVVTMGSCGGHPSEEPGETGGNLPWVTVWGADPLTGRPLSSSAKSLCQALKIFNQQERARPDGGVPWTFEGQKLKPQTDDLSSAQESAGRLAEFLRKWGSGACW